MIDAVLSAAVLAATLAFTPADATNAFARAAEFVRDCTPRDAGTPGGLNAARWIADQAGRTGADATLDSFSARVPGGAQAQFCNVEVEFPGADNRWIVLISHFDTAPGIGPRFESANDGASTTGLLISLAAAIRRAGVAYRRHPIALVWTDAEEKRVAYGPDDGFQGSVRAAWRFASRGRDVLAAVCLDMLGDRDLNVSVPANGDADLTDLVFKAADDAGLSGLVRRMPEGVRVLDDHVAFLDRGYPAVDLIDFEYGSAPGLNDYWHTERDTVDKISADSLGKAGRLVAALLDRLEARR